MRYDFTSFYSYVGENPVLWQDPLGLWKCKKGDSGNLQPGLKDSLDLFEKCTGLDINVTCGTCSHPPTIDKNGVAKADPHFWGTAVDIGHNNNPGLPCHSLRSVSTRPSRIKTRRLELGGATPSRNTTLTIQQTDGTTISNIMEAFTADKASSPILSIRMDTKRWRMT